MWVVVFFVSLTVYPGIVSDVKSNSGWMTHSWMSILLLVRCHYAITCCLRDPLMQRFCCSTSFLPFYCSRPNSTSLIGWDELRQDGSFCLHPKPFSCHRCCDLYLFHCSFSVQNRHILRTSCFQSASWPSSPTATDTFLLSVSSTLHAAMCSLACSANLCTFHNPGMMYAPALVDDHEKEATGYIMVLPS